MNYLDGLNDEQKEAVLHTEGPLLVVAGAGTGKTSTLTRRVYHLIQQGIRPDNILAITFTNKAASEMRERIAALHNNPFDVKPFVSTFHALGVHILRNHGEKLGIKRHFSIFDQQDAVSAIKRAMGKVSIDPKEWNPNKVLDRIGHLKGKLATPKSTQEANNPWDDIVTTVWPHYEAIKNQEQGLDFADLLLKAHELLDRFPEVRDHYKNQWKYIHVDEYQDTNHVQHQIVKLLLNKECNLCAVGDGDQNIYTWRGANVSNILRFEQDFPGAKAVFLERNYRSTKTILEASHEIIRKNKARIDKKLFTSREDKQPITIFHGANEQDEAHWVANTITGLLKDGIPAEEIVVLFRTNFQSRILEEACLYYDIPYQVVGTKFFERKEVKDALAYLKAALNPDSLTDIKRTINTPKRGIGQTSVLKIFSGQASSLPTKAKEKYENYQNTLLSIAKYTQTNTPSEVIKYIIEESGLKADLLKEGDGDERVANLEELVSYATRYDGLDPNIGIEQLLEHTALMSDQDELASKKEHSSVRLMTIHAAKGLEFKHVFIVGLEQGLFPSEREGKEDDEEERRLCYVAFTRAKDKLYLSHAQLRRIFGQTSIQTPSEFLLDVPDHLTEEANTDHPGRIKTIYLDF